MIESRARICDAPSSWVYNGWLTCKRLGGAGIPGRGRRSEDVPGINMLNCVASQCLGSLPIGNGRHPVLKSVEIAGEYRYCVCRCSSADRFCYRFELRTSTPYTSVFVFQMCRAENDWAAKISKLDAQGEPGTYSFFPSSNVFSISCCISPIKSDGKLYSEIF